MAFSNGFDRRFSFWVYFLAVLLILLGTANAILRDNPGQPSRESIDYLAKQLRSSANPQPAVPTPAWGGSSSDKSVIDAPLSVESVSGSNPWQLLLSKYDSRLGTLTLNVFAQITFVLLGLSILRTTAGDSATLDRDETPLPFVGWTIKTWQLLFLIPIALSILWFHFGLLLFELIRTRVLAFEVAAECGDVLVARALDTAFQDGLFLDAWFISHRPEQTGMRVANSWFHGGLMYLFPATLLGLTHSTIFLLLRALVRVRQPVWKQSPAFFLVVKKLNLVQVCASVTLVALVASHVFFGGLPFLVSNDPEMRGNPTFVTAWIGIVVVLSYFAFSKAFKFGESDESPQVVARRRRRARLRKRSRRNAHSRPPTA